MSITSFFQDDLQQLQSKGLYRQLSQVDSSQGKEIILNGQKVLNFSSNNYLGLADDERIKKAAVEAIGQYGFGSGASRLISGTMSAHVQLEKKLAAFKGTQAALFFSSGYMANVGVIPALMGRSDVVFSDRLNHASIVDGIILSRAHLCRYAHKDMQALQGALRKAGSYKKRLIVTDSIFSMDGDAAPLKEIVRLAKQYNALVMVDEAHGLGVFGERGAGLVEQEGLEGQVDIQMGTLSKAAGCFGAYIAGSQALCDYLINHSRSFIYSTALVPAVASAASCAIDLIQEDKLRRQELMSKAKYVREELARRGLDTLQSTSPIIPIILKDSDRAIAVSQRLLKKGIFVQAIRPPTVPVNTARLRITVMATHTYPELELLLRSIDESIAL